MDPIKGWKAVARFSRICLDAFFLVLVAVEEYNETQERSKIKVTTTDIVI